MTESIPITPSSWRQRIWSALARLPMWAVVVFAFILLFAATAWGLLGPIIRERQAIQRLESYPDVKVLGGQFTTGFTYCGLATPPPPPPVWDQTIARMTNGGTWEPDEVTIFLKAETPVRALNDLKSLRKIGRIVFAGPKWTDRETALVVGSLRFKQLMMSGTGVTREGWKALERSAVEELDVRDQPLGPEFFRVARRMPRLESLSLESDKIAGDHLTLLAGHPNLKDLSLSRGSFGSDCIEVLATLPELTHLRLNRSAIDDGFLRQLGRLPRLKELSIAQTKITDAGLAAIPESVRLETLDLDQTAITEIGLLNLKTVPKTLRLVGTKVRVTEPVKRWLLSHSFEEVALDESQLDPTSQLADELSGHIDFLNITTADSATE